MSNDESPTEPVQRDRREAVREKAQQVQAQQSRARVIRRTAVGVGAVAIVAVAAVVVAWAFSSSSSKTLVQPANVSNDGIIVTTVAGVATEPAAGDVADAPGADAPAAAPTEAAAPAPTETAPPAVDIRVYVDYLSAGASDFQTANVKQLSKWVSEDAATLTYYPVAMLTAKSKGTKYSLRAASAAACVATHAPDTFFKFNNELLAQRPDVDSDGLTDSELAALAIAQGTDAPKALRSCIENESFAMWAKAATDRALQGLPDTDGIALTGTPTILVNGIPYVGAVDDPKEFAQFVLTIASDAYYKTPSPAPSGSTSATPTPSN
ncbi:protein-disulfide isomerase [Microbacterium sp. Root61]|uniref:DsbA family protein n=1 Tax=Microbacterium sp. Root61 TaxID=1736570 RepID=UPI0006FC7024|nr:thioredoxin domain-containing protein [Microbacterium sp. Root61]KRA24115.1 protein-disulfide isomerase [Microbacterium sp. Root61]